MAINQELPAAVSVPAVSCKVGEGWAHRSAGVGRRSRDLSVSVMHACHLNALCWLRALRSWKLSCPISDPSAFVWKCLPKALVCGWAWLSQSGTEGQTKSQNSVSLRPTRSQRIFNKVPAMGKGSWEFSHGGKAHPELQVTA